MRIFNELQGPLPVSWIGHTRCIISVKLKLINPASGYSFREPYVNGRTDDGRTDDTHHIIIRPTLIRLIKTDIQKYQYQIRYGRVMILEAILKLSFRVWTTQHSRPNGTTAWLLKTWPLHCHSMSSAHQAGGWLPQILSCFEVLLQLPTLEKN